MKICSKIIIAIAILIGYMSCSNNQGNESIPAKKANPNEQVNFKEPEIISTTIVEMYDDNTPKEIMVTFKDDTKMSLKVIDHSKLSVSSPYKGHYRGDVIIPSKVNINGKDYPVTSIAFEAFSGEEVTSVFIPNSVTEIKKVAFERCEKLTSITITGCIKTIGNRAFADCPQLISVNFMEGVKYIGPGMFEDCTGLTSVSIPKSVTMIYPEAFKGCTNLTAVHIPEGVKTIAAEAFSDCSSLASITIPQSVDCILPHAFYGTAWYNSQPDGLIVIGQVAYEYKGEAPENTSIVIPKTVTSITSGAFADNKGITFIEIPSSVNDIGFHAFEGTTWFDNQPDGLIRIGDAIYTYKGDYTYKGEIRRGASVNIPEGVTRIFSYAFYERYDLATVTLPNSVTSIGRGAFKGCSDLASINIPEGVTCIEDETFSDCESLTEIIIPNSVTAIGVSAFHNCRMLPEITIPSSVTAIGDGAFWYCEELTSVIIQNPNLQIDFEKVFKVCEKLQRSNVIYASGSGSASNPSSVSTPTSAKSKVYSNAYDGFVNIRQAPQSKAPILGVLRNGPEGAILLGTEGEWKKIDCNGIVGYVYEKYVQDTPTEVFHGE